MDGIELVTMIGKIVERIRLVELERVSLLWRNVHADNVEARAVVAHAGTASAAVQIE
jgi:hypothetical protein